MRLLVLGTGGMANTHAEHFAAIDGVELRLIDTDGEDSLVGDPGEIWVRGPSVFQGYWNDADATRAAIDADGWLHTGDIALVTDEGYLYLVDRAKDLIIVSGFNVFPSEVEEVIAEMADVTAVAVVGVPDPVQGEAVVAWVSPSDHADRDTLSEEILDRCRRRLAGYKIPSVVHLVDRLPYTLTGKVQRGRLRSMENERVVGSLE